jgi:hemerythrin
VALIVWKDAMSVGNDALDDDHIVVASLINHIDDAKQSGTDEHAVGRILRVLVDHAFAHFAREEALLEQRGYPRLAEHKREHRLVEEQLQELCEAYARTADPELSREIMQTGGVSKGGNGHEFCLRSPPCSCSDDNVRRRSGACRWRPRRRAEGVQ